MSNSVPDVSIIIRTKNEEQFVQKTLEMIFKQEIDLVYEVIVIDSGSTDRTLDLVRQFDIRLYRMDQKNFSYGYALNFGAELSKGEFLINLSAHCVPFDTHWMKNLLEPLRRDPSVAAAYGRQVPMKGMNPFEELSLISCFSSENNQNADATFSNANCVIRKKVWQKFKFDALASFAEDYIWSKTLPEEYRIKYISSSAVYHSHPLILKYWAKRYYDNGVMVEYLRRVYGLQYPYKIDKSFIRFMKNEIYHYLIFLIRNRYFRFIPVCLIFPVLKYVYYTKGQKAGRKHIKQKEQIVE